MMEKIALKEKPKMIIGGLQLIPVNGTMRE